MVIIVFKPSFGLLQIREQINFTVFRLYYRVIVMYLNKLATFKSRLKIRCIDKEMS